MNYDKLSRYFDIIKKAGSPQEVEHGLTASGITDEDALELEALLRLGMEGVDNPDAVIREKMKTLKTQENKPIKDIASKFPLLERAIKGAEVVIWGA